MHSPQPSARARGLLFAALSFLAVTGLAGLSAAEPASVLSPEIGQLGTPIEWITVPGSGGLLHMAQRSRDGRLFLTPNESFFPKRGLKATGKGVIPDVAEELNKGDSFATITGWDEGDQAEWGIWIEEPGDLTLHVTMSDTESRSRFTLNLDSQTESFSAPKASAGDPRFAATATFRVTEPGRHSVLLTSETNAPGAGLHWIELSGPAAAKSAVLRQRWRPAAAHGRFSSSKTSRNTRLWIMEMDAVPGDLGFYSPLTTPFGYYGPSWNADGTVQAGFNFSLWSFGRNEKEPPVEQLSHLLAIGSRDASFGVFDHEGTGVKIRDWEPLAGRQGQRQALALRVEPGEDYDTYYSYFFATDEKRWRLFGAGNKWNKGKPLENLWVGSFVEVPGTASAQRTGPYPRTMRYRGWVMDEHGKGLALDRLSTGDVDKETGLTHTDRGTTEDGWFYLQTGGWVFRKAPAKDAIELRPPSGRPPVDYLDPDDLAFLQTTPSAVNGTTLERSGERARVAFDIRNLGTNPEVTLYWGPEESLTFADRWPSTVEIKNPREGANTHDLENLPATAPLHVRLFLKNDEGQFWSTATLTD